MRLFALNCFSHPAHLTQHCAELVGLRDAKGRAEWNYFGLVAHIFNNKKEH